MAASKKPKIIVIVGPNASGKSALAVTLAKKFNGEVISADSRQVYRGLNIGTGKVTKTEMSSVPHHLIDVADPKRVFSAADFVRLGRKAISNVARREKVPIVVGGTGFYISALLGEMSLPQVEPNKKLRKQLEAKNPAQLFSILEKLNPTRAQAIDPLNKHRLVRAIEIAKAIGSTPKCSSILEYEVLKIGIKHSDKVLRDRIHERLIARMRRGMAAEAKRLHEKGLSYARMHTLGLEYRYLADYLQNELSKQEFLEILENKIWQYAKRQITWFKKDKEIKWFKLHESDKIHRAVNIFLKA